MEKNDLRIVYVPITSLISAPYNPRYQSEDAKKHLAESITKFGVVDALIVNSAEGRKNIVIGGNFRLEMLKKLGHTEVPVVYVNIPDIEKEKELCLRLNKNQGEEEYLIEQLQALMDKVDINELGLKERIRSEVERHKKFQAQVMGNEEKIKVSDIDIRQYAKYLLKEGEMYEKRGLLACLKSLILVKEKKISLKQS